MNFISIKRGRELGKEERGGGGGNRNPLRLVLAKGASMKKSWMSLRESRDSNHSLGPGSGVGRHARADAPVLGPQALLSELLRAHLLSVLKLPWPFLPLHVYCGKQSPESHKASQ